jgi:protein arginine kinase activator
MLCDKCKKNEATTHIKTNINGVVSSHNLCAHCAAQYGGSPFGMGISQMLGSFFDGGSAPVGKTVRCPQCGASFEEIAASGKVGCDKCYEVFLDRLVPSLERMHGRSKHVGKAPAVHLAQAEQHSAADELDRLRAELRAAIEVQEFERAAELRDKIKALEAESNE